MSNVNQFLKKIKNETNELLRKLLNETSELLELKKYPIGIIPGVLVIGFFYAFTFISMAFYPTSFSPLNNWLSDLGNSNYNPKGAFLYNLGCILTGAMLFPFYLGMYKFYRKDFYSFNVRHLGLEVNIHKFSVIGIQIVGCLSGFSLIMLGVFPSEYSGPHMIWAGMFFWLNLWVLILGNIALLFHKDFIKPIAIYGWVAATINVIFIFLTIFNIISPLMEWISVSTALGYVALLEFNRYKTLD